MYCLSILLEFTFRVDDKSINVNGKSFRIFSALRYEVMVFFVKTHLEVSTSTSKDPMSLAAEMCSRLTFAPVKEIVHDEEDDTLLRALVILIGIFLLSLLGIVRIVC